MPGITFEPVDNHYEWGTYFDLKVLIMTRNGYINATRMCNDEGKRFKYWLENQASKDFISHVQSIEGIPADLMMIKNGNGVNEYRGTYVHPDLITHVAFWVSSSFAHKVSKIVEEYHIKEQKKLNNKLIFDISEKDNTISKLEAKLDTILNNTNKLDSKITDLTDEVSKLSLDNQITHEMLNVVVEDRVVRPKDESVMNILVIYESIDRGPNMFYTFRVQKRGLKAALRRYKADNPNAIKFYEIEYNPNSINYFIRFKEQLGSNAKWHYNSFELLNITKDQLREFIAKVNNEKYELENCI